MTLPLDLKHSIHSYDAGMSMQIDWHQAEILPVDSMLLGTFDHYVQEVCFMDQTGS